MKNIKHYLWVSFILIVISFFMFLIQYFLFGQLENTLYYSLMNICIIPINILAVTIVFDKLVERRARADKISKLNMLVGLFFSDIGFTLLKQIAIADESIRSIGLDFNDLKNCKEKLLLHDHEINFQKIDYAELKELVIGGREILSSLIGNENILEHEIFADLLMSLMHLRDELIFIKHKELTDEDCKHIKGDVSRVYKALTLQWINYLDHLKQYYPYQFNSSIKYNPF